MLGMSFQAANADKFASRWLCIVTDRSWIRNLGTPRLYGFLEKMKVVPGISIDGMGGWVMRILPDPFGLLAIWDFNPV